jgi:hypothetical protein
VFELGFRGLFEPFRRDRPTNVFLAGLGYICMGLLAGLVSLWIVPKHVIASEAIRYVNLAATPILIGILFELFGRRSQSRGNEKTLFDRFSYGFLFALAMGLIRLILAG